MNQTQIPGFAATFESELAAVKASGCRYVRIGGIAPNWDQLYNFHASTFTIGSGSAPRLEYLISKIRAAGMDVIIQVSYNPLLPQLHLAERVQPAWPVDVAAAGRGGGKPGGLPE